MTLSFFRRHRKMFMVVMFASLISMVFFGSWPSMGPKLTQWWYGTGEHTVIGTIAGREVREGEMSKFYQDLSIAGQASQFWMARLRPTVTSAEAAMRLHRCTMGASAYQVVGPVLFQEKASCAAILTYLAFYQEAAAAGFDTSADEAEARMKAVEALGLPAEDMARVIRLAGGRHERLVEALRTDMTLRAYMNWVSEDLSGGVTPELHSEFVKYDDRIKVRLAVIKAADLIAEIKDIPEDEVKQQFEKFKAFLPGKSPEGYGYRIPDRVQIEYLVADPKGFTAKAEAGVAEKDVEEYYNARKDPEFLAKEEKAAGPKAEARQEAKKFRPLAEVRSDIRKVLVDQQAASLALEQLHGLVAEIRRLHPAPKLEIFADGKQVRYVGLAGLETDAQLASLPGIGKAERAGEPLAAAAAAMKELVGEKDAKCSLMEISEPFVGPQNESYAFRVVAFKANHEPALLAEVRDQVVADLRLAKAFELAAARAKTLFDAASAKGLEDAAKTAGVKSAESDWVPRVRLVLVQDVGQFMAVPATFPEVGSNPVVTDAFFRMADENKRLTQVTLAKDKAVVVAELVGRRLPRQALFEKMRPLLAGQVAIEVGGPAWRQVLSLEAIQKRMDVVLKVPPDYQLGRGYRGGYEE
jgi:hypothetical protein